MAYSLFCDPPRSRADRHRLVGRDSIDRRLLAGGGHDIVGGVVAETWALTVAIHPPWMSAKAFVPLRPSLPVWFHWA